MTTTLRYTSSQPWCRVTPTSGSNDGKFTIILDEYDDETEDREAVITVSGDGVTSQKITVTQLHKGGKYLVVSPSTPITFTADAGQTATINVTSNTDWTVNSSATAVCGVSPASGSGNGTVTVTSFENTSTTDDRNATIIFTPDGASNATVSVTQKKKSVDPDPPTVEEFWYSSNYIVDIAVDDYVVHNYNFGQHTHGTSMGWENQTHERREYLANVAVIPNFADDYVYGTKYAQYSDYKQVTRGSNNIKFYRYEFVETTESQYNADNTNRYKLEGPFSGIGGIDSSSLSYVKVVQDIGDDAGRAPIFNLNYGRVRPLGHVDTDKNERVPLDPGNIWNSIYNATMVVIISGDPTKDDNIDLNSDAPTSYPSGHAAQTWTVAMILLQAYHDSIDTALNYIREAYRVGVARTVGRFHWNSDTMYGRLWATMIMPVINAMPRLVIDNKGNTWEYTSLCSALNVSSGILNPADLTDEDYSSAFNELVGKFTDIVTIDGEVRRYLWAMYKAASTVLSTSGHVFLAQTTYPEVYPTAGHTITINGTQKTVKLRGNNTTYYSGSSVMDDVRREDIMQSWLMAMNLTEIYLSKDNAP